MYRSGSDTGFYDKCRVVRALRVYLRPRFSLHRTENDNINLQPLKCRYHSDMEFSVQCKCSMSANIYFEQGDCTRNFAFLLHRLLPTSEKIQAMVYEWNEREDARLMLSDNAICMDALDTAVKHNIYPSFVTSIAS